MSIVSINIPEEVMLNVCETKEDFCKYVKLVIAFDLYNKRKVSLGYCCEVAEMSEEDFIQCLGNYGFSVFGFDSEQEMREELANA